LAKSSCPKKGFVDIERFDVPFTWEFADPAIYARTLASTGPAYEAIQNVGEDEFTRTAMERASEKMREGLVLRAVINVVGFPRTEAQAKWKGPKMSSIGFLKLPPVTPEAQALFDEDVAEDGYVMNVTKLWSHHAALMTSLFDLMGQTIADQDLSFRQRGILVAACASTLGDSYCSLAWGSKLAGVSDPKLAAAVIRGNDDGLSDDERALASWARKVAGDPNHTTSQDVEILRSAGFNDSQVFAMTVFTALRLAFSTVNDALGVGPDAVLYAAAPEAVAEAIEFGRAAE
jgi:alkylhydroperoxidase family enzyme